MNDGLSYRFNDRQVQRLLPHRPPMLLVDGVASCALDLSHLEAIKAVSAADPMTVRLKGGRAFFPPTLMIEAMAQTCGLLMNLRWLAAESADLAAFANGDDEAIGEYCIPHSVLAETRAKQSRLVRSGDGLRLLARVILQRGQMVRFSSKAMNADGVCAEMEVLLAFPDYMIRDARARGGKTTEVLLSARGSHE